MNSNILYTIGRVVIIVITLINIAHFCGYVLPSIDVSSVASETLVVLHQSSVANTSLPQPHTLPQLSQPVANPALKSPPQITQTPQHTHSNHTFSTIDKKSRHPNNRSCILPPGFPHGPPGWKRLIRICANLDKFSISCMDNQTCIECLPPWSGKPLWLYKFVKQFTSDEYNSRNSRRNNLQSLINSHLSPNISSTPITLMTLNKGYVYLFLNWVCSLESLNILEPLRRATIIITTDIHAQKAVQEAGFAAVITDWISEDEDIAIDEAAAGAFALGPHRWTVSLQIVYTFDLVHMGYNVIQQDVDVVWLHDVREFFDYDVNALSDSQDGRNMDIDVAMACDGRLDYVGPGNSGFVFVESNCKTKVFMDTLVYYIGMVIQARSDQVHWNMFLTSYDFRQLVYRMLPPDKFVGGDQFGNGPHRKDKLSSDIWFLHASWTGTHGEKVTKFKTLDAWFLNEECSLYNESLVPEHTPPGYVVKPEDRTWVWPDPKQDSWWASKDEGATPPYKVQKGR